MGIRYQTVNLILGINGKSMEKLLKHIEFKATFRKEEKGQLL